MHIGEAVIDSLAANGIDTVFGIPGVQTLPLNKSIEGRNDIRFVMIRHETAAPHAAWGYAESSGEPAATFVIPGPGDMNAMNGLKNALNDCTPLVHIAVETDPDIRGGDSIHEVDPDTYDNVVKMNTLIETPESTVAELERAIAIAETPPKGPVRVGIPKSFLTMNVELTDVGGYGQEPLFDPSESAIKRAVDCLEDAEPTIIAGGGVRSSEAGEELRAVAERLDAPVTVTYKGKGVFPEDHELFASGFCHSSSTELKELVADSDVVLAVGTDIDAHTTGDWAMDLPDLIHVTLDAHDIGRGYPAKVGIAADAADTLSALNERLSGRDAGVKNGASRAASVREGESQKMDELVEVSDPPLTSPSALAAIRDALDREDIVTVDPGGFGIWAVLGFETYEPRTYVRPGSWASMGTGLPSAIGAQLANPDDHVVTLTGDGGLFMCVHELHTAVDEDIPVTTIVFNNDDYAIISEAAERSYQLPEGSYRWDRSPASFVDLAGSVGMKGTRVETPAEIKKALSEAATSDEPMLIEIPIDPREPQAGPWMSDDPVH